jgi:glycine/D-amino acid oxidase-like deaminating enzyme/nitrite reductase/ring-hydroxylating ferredoxin subunit
MRQGTLQSVWRRTAPTPYRQLVGELSVDVLVVGAGITGVTLSLALARTGRSVALIDAGEIGAGSTGGSTGNLYSTVSDGMANLVEKWGIDSMRRVVAARQWAVEAIAETAARYRIACGFVRCPLHWQATSEAAAVDMQDEFIALRRCGLSPRIEDGITPCAGWHVGPALVLDGQAQFDPMCYLDALAQEANNSGCHIFTHTPALSIDHDKHEVETPSGRVKAGEIALATHTPSGFHPIQAGMVVKREYGLAFRNPGVSWSPGIFWTRGEHRISVRPFDAMEGNFLIAVGESHPTGRHDANQALLDLEAEAGICLGEMAPAYRWSAQNFRSPDGLPYIGRDPMGSFIATGFATDGLVYGTLAAHIIADHLLGRDNPHADLFDAGRFTPIKSAKGAAEEIATMVTSLASDYLGGGDRAGLDLAPGSAAIVEVDGDKVAAYRDPGGVLHVLSPVCTHLKCLVHWNAAEVSWDCPCHGSRFSPDGSVLEGPALKPLRHLRQSP